MLPLTDIKIAEQASNGSAGENEGLRDQAGFDAHLPLPRYVCGRNSGVQNSFSARAASDPRPRAIPLALELRIGLFFAMLHGNGERHREGLF